VAGLVSGTERCLIQTVLECNNVWYWCGNPSTMLTLLPCPALCCGSAVALLQLWQVMQSSGGTLSAVP
jgi:hypothetical protein